MRILAPALFALLLMVAMTAPSDAFDAKSFYDQQGRQSGGTSGG